MTVSKGQPYSGPLACDLTSIAAILVDQPPGGLIGVRREQAGIEEVIDELLGSMASNGEEAGVPKEAYARFVDGTKKLEMLRAHSAALHKMAEVLAESEATYENQREMALSQIVDAVRSTAKRTRSQAVVAPFEKSIRYTQQAAEKAVRTRRLRAAAKAAAEGKLADA